MLYKRSFWTFLFIWGILICCTGCQEGPTEKTVPNKGEIIFDAKGTATDVEIHPPGETTNVNFNSSFESTDGSVNYTLAINKSISTSSMPIIQVLPKYLTADDAKMVAYTLFPNTEFYEAEPQVSENFSKEEIREKLNRWSSYTNAYAIEDLLGDSESARTLEIVKNYIEEYTEMYEGAPEENPHFPCEWKMRKSSQYLFLKDELVGMDLSNDNDEVSAQCRVNGIPYRFSATTRNKNDFKVNIITCYIDDGLSPRNIDERIFTAKLCRTEEPTRMQIESIQSKAKLLLSEFDLGQWEIDQCYVETRNIGDALEHMVRVNAVPAFNGVPALRRPQLSSLRNEEGYASSQYLTDVQFVFSSNGELISFALFTPLTTQEVINENVKVMEIEELLSHAQTILQLTDAYHYGFGEYLPLISEGVQCNVTVSEMEYGLSRIRVPNTDDSYYYVPSLILKGSSEYIGQESGKTFYASKEPEVLMVINAVDGTIINATNT